MRLQDHTGVVSLTLFDREAKKLLNISAKDLIGSSQYKYVIQIINMYTSSFTQCILIVDDNVTHASNTEKSTATSPLVHAKNSSVSSTSYQLKRNLSVAYDIDPLTTNLNNKLPRGSVSLGQEDGVKLLVPKLEKVSMVLDFGIAICSSMCFRFLPFTISSLCHLLRLILSPDSGFLSSSPAAYSCHRSVGDLDWRRITLWEKKANLIQPDRAKGKAIEVTSNTITVYYVVQLESTVSTTVELSANFPELQSYIDRFNALEDIQEEDTTRQLPFCCRK
ncbi:hypothetical protein QVD17_30980 [Tagetes erecta]|uniref:Uncharacterized protein n=1 Tax=Tagetes erecta TaxID=13708 RepID=A0AAD8K2V0_TARER|nr:hypothetical protein QVD17_30980 [Tagetes erecta]